MTDRTIVHTDAAPKAVGPYSQAITAGGFLYSAGQVAIAPLLGEAQRTHQLG